MCKWFLVIVAIQIHNSLLRLSSSFGQIYIHTYKAKTFTVTCKNFFPASHKTVFTLRKFMTVAGMSLAHANLHLGQQ